MTKINISLCLISCFMAWSIAQSGLSASACWLDSYGRGAGTIPGRVADCPSGYTNMGLTCFRPTDLHVAPSIVANCPAGYRNIGLVCAKSLFDWKKSNSMSCPSGYFLNSKLGRCYVNCEANHVNTGEFCAMKTSSLDKSAMTCLPGEVKGDFGVRCFPAAGPCGADGESNAGLCYKKCSTGYKGVGPVCWGTCPSSLPYSCGAACAKSASGCASLVWAQVSSVGQLASTIATLGTGAAASAAATAPEKAANLSALRQQYDTMVKAFNSIKDMPQVKTAIANAQTAKTLVSGVKTVSGGAIELANAEVVTAADIVRISAQIAALVDTTGVSSIVAAYSLPKCSTQFNAAAAAAPEKKVGYCYSANADNSWWILKAVDKPGWVAGDLCHATDGTITEWGQKPCKGGTKQQCLDAASTL